MGCSPSSPSVLWSQAIRSKCSDVRLEHRKSGSSRDVSLPVTTGSHRPCYSEHLHDSACPLFWMHNLHIAKVSDTSSHMHVRVTMVIRRFFAARFGGDAGSQTFRLHGLNTANLVSSGDKSLHSATGMRKHAGHWVAQHPHRRCFGDAAVPRIFRTHCLITANEGSSRDTSLDAATGSGRRCCVVHPGDSACLLFRAVHLDGKLER